jgi:amidohydrolase
MVADKLRSFGCDEVVTGIGRTGVVGIIKGKTDTATAAPSGLRADMDALPIHEARACPMPRSTPGAMHACGHDGHTAMLLGAAKYLAETRNFDGTVVVIFQPAEEGGGGGREMVDDGMMERFGIDEVYGMHNLPGLPVGQFAIRKGPIFAADRPFRCHHHRPGGHAAKPHQTVDTTLPPAIRLLAAVDRLAQRRSRWSRSLVVSVTSFETARPTTSSRNRELAGTVRTLSAEMRDLAETRINEIVRGGRGPRRRGRVNYIRNYPVTFNHSDETDFAADIGRERCRCAAMVEREQPPTMGGEDFAFMLEARPGAYIFMGNGDTAACITRPMTSTTRPSRRAVRGGPSAARRADQPS